ncbi:MAG: hypothetical protein KAH23_06910 [Kiritimatiellae bacterium]|nr:hypothetical protein [Kiritimatiellia bacterium]
MREERRMIEKVSKRRRVLISLVCVVLLVVCWFTGLIGFIIGRFILPGLSPCSVGKSVEITEVGYGASHLPLKKGITIAISAERLKRMLEDGWRWGVLVPPGLMRNGMVLKGAWFPRDFHLPPHNRVPIMIIVDPAAEHPQIRCRYPANETNDIMENQVAEALRDTKEYILGTYETIYYIRFKTLHIRTDNSDLDTDVDKRTVLLEATGRVRMFVEDNLLTLRNTGKVKSLNGKVSFNLYHDSRGIRLRYNAEIEELIINFHNMAPWLDKKLSKKLRKSWQRSLNKEKKKQKMEKRCLPGWIPMDIVFDFKLTV